MPKNQHLTPNARRPTSKQIGIIGGGIMGLATAYYLNKRGLQVTILEKEKEIGGLSRSVEILPDIYWDRYYHVILSTDKELLEFIDELGLSLDVQWRETKTGFYSNGQLHSMSTTTEFLKFKPLSFIDKIRLGIGILYTSKIKSWRRLEKIYVQTWLIRVFGRRNYEKMWEPLLRSKLGTAKDQVSAALIWATINRYYGTRNSSSKKELMGCVKGGYYSILNQIRDRLSENGTQIVTDYEVKTIEPLDKGQNRVISQKGLPLDFSRVVATIPNPRLKALMHNLNNNLETQLDEVTYLRLICVSLVLKRSLTPFYVTNLTDNNLPFTGLIEATNVMPLDTLNGCTLVYLPKYIPSDDPFYEKTDKEVADLFMGALKSMFPDLSENDFISHSVYRESYVQPLHTIDYSKKIPPMKTPLKNIYIANTAMILNSTLNNNEVIKIAKRAAELVASDN